jgi:hypothetical protein
LVPKETADYVFYLCADDFAELSVSTDASARNLKAVAWLDQWRSFREWERITPENISKPIHLEAGKRYFIEVLHTEDGGGDQVSVTWRKAGEPAPKNGDAPISGEFLARPAE